MLCKLNINKYTRKYEIGNTSTLALAPCKLNLIGKSSIVSRKKYRYIFFC